MLHRMAFRLSGKVVALHLDNSTAKAYLCNQGGTVSPFLSRLACGILSLTDKHGITLLPSIHSYPPQCGGRFSVSGLAASGVAPSTSGGSGSFLPLGPSTGGPAGIFSFYSMPALFHFGNSTASGALGLNAFSHPWNFQVSYVSSSGSGPSCSGQVSSRTCQQSTQTFTFGGSMLDGSSLLPTVLGMLADVPRQCPIVKDLVVDVSVGQVLTGLRYLHLTLWLLSNVCYANKGSLPQSIRWWQRQLRMSTSRVYQQCWREWAGWCAQQGLPNNAISAPKLANFCYICFRSDWPGIPLESIVLLFLHFWNLIAFTRHLIILLFLN